MVPTITAFENSPDGGRGLARDMGVRWALEEVGQAYKVRLVSFSAMKQPTHRNSHPFGQIPTYEDGDLILFESGAIVLHIAETHAGLLPKASAARARTITWMFAAVSTLEPPILHRISAIIHEHDQAWHEQRLQIIDAPIRARLADLSTYLGNADWLEDTFSAGDLMVICVLRRLSRWGVLEEYPNLAAYVTRAEARPAFKRAFAAQLAVFNAAAAMT